MVEWIAGIGSFLKGLFGSKGANQIGKENQAVTGSTTGNNSPMVTAGRDVYFSMPAGVVGEDAEMFRDLEKLMPDVLAELRRLLAETPLTRTMIVVDKKGYIANWPDPHFRFNEDEEPGTWNKVKILENHGLLICEKHRYAYRITEKLAKYLTKS
ncbi:MAG TPA: hypothetical protein VH682_28210 [Gemmataceae bacterium]|jgi:uncharacterized protein YbaR (Trm112 family)